MLHVIEKKRATVVNGFHIHINLYEMPSHFFPNI